MLKTYLPSAFLLGCFLFTISKQCHADIPWEDARARLVRENAALEKRPGGRSNTYFMICTVYYTPMESGFTAARGFDVTTQTKPGLGARRYGREFLEAVYREGIGKLATPVNGLHYMRYEGRGRYSFCSRPTGLDRGAIHARKSCAVHKLRRAKFRTGHLQILEPGVNEVFGNAKWKVADAGHGLHPWQVDLYWGEDEPMGPGRLASRPKGTPFEYSYALVRLVE